MTGRHVVVTGGTAGIGLAIARKLACQGDAVFVCGRNEERLNKAVANVVAAAPGAAVKGAVCDVSRLASVEAMIAEAKREMGAIDTLVNSAGVSFIREVGEMPPEAWSEIIETNLTGTYNCSHAVVAHLKEAAAARGVADIVNLGSRSGRYSFRGGVGYNATKFGVQGMTEAMFLDLNEFGIRVGLVAPGTVATGFGGAATADWQLQPEDVADAVASMIGARPGACINWIELRPARPPK